ncbi:GntR family transcriptional regulator [Ensifer adhaerens]
MASAKQFNYPVWTMVVREKSGGPTLQEQLFIQLRRLIVNGQLARGARLPASRSMATDLAISRNTVNIAYDRLAAEGYIKRRPSSGFYVEESLPEELGAAWRRKRPAAFEFTGCAVCTGERGVGTALELVAPGQVRSQSWHAGAGYLPLQAVRQDRRQLLATLHGF